MAKAELQYADGGAGRREDEEEDDDEGHVNEENHKRVPQVHEENHKLAPHVPGDPRAGAAEKGPSQRLREVTNCLHDSTNFNPRPYCSTESECMTCRG